MNAGEIRGKFFLYKDRWDSENPHYHGVFFLIAVVLWAATLMYEGWVPGIFSLIFFAISSFIVLSSFSAKREMTALKRMLAEYEAKWLELVWTPEGFSRKTLSLFATDGEAFFAEKLVGLRGLGRYNPLDDYLDVLRSGTSDTEQEHLLCGMILILHNGHLTLTINGSGWSPAIREKYFALPVSRMPESFDPDNPDQNLINYFRSGRAPSGAMLV